MAASSAVTREDTVTDDPRLVSAGDGRVGGHRAARLLGRRTAAAGAHREPVTAGVLRAMLADYLV